MTAAKIYSLFLLILICGVASAQEEVPASETVEIPRAAQPEIRKVQLPELEGVSITELRKQFPRLSGIMASSCRIPDYGPMLNISLYASPYLFYGSGFEGARRCSKESRSSGWSHS